MKNLSSFGNNYIILLPPFPCIIICYHFIENTSIPNISEVPASIYPNKTSFKKLELFIQVPYHE